MHVLFDARLATAKYPRIIRYASGLATALADLFKTTGDRLTVVRHPSCKFRLPDMENVLQTTCVAPPEDPSAQLPMRKLAERLKPDIYHTPHRICPSIGYNAPIVLTIHNCAPIKCRYETSPQESIAFMESLSASLKACTRAMTVSNATLEDVRSIFPDLAYKCVTVPPGVGPEFHEYDEETCDRISLSYDYTRPCLLYMGGAEPHKNLYNMLKAYSKAVTLVHGIDLVLGVYGTPAKLQKLKQFSDSLGIGQHVRFLPEIIPSDVPYIISSAHAMILPSIHEGFGLPMLEAMSAGTPVAASATPALLDLGGGDNGAALYFDPESVDDMSQAIVRIALDTSLRDRLRTEGPKRAKNYTWSNVAKAALSLYKDALND